MGSAFSRALRLDPGEQPGFFMLNRVEELMLCRCVWLVGLMCGKYFVKHRYIWPECSLVIMRN